MKFKPGDIVQNARAGRLNQRRTLYLVLTNPDDWRINPRFFNLTRGKTESFPSHMVEDMFAMWQSL